MSKRAVCVGINDYPIRDADLKGCVNDANAWANLLVDHFEFDRGDIRIITDKDAKAATIVEALNELFAGASDGDVLVFTNSSHGSYVVDDNDDEPDGYDEILCPYDVRKTSITDDQLRAVLGAVPAGVQAIVISDSCHSGNVTRIFPSEEEERQDRRIRFLNPGRIRPARIIADALAAEPRAKIAYPESGMNHLLLSGCRDNEVSYDAFLDGDYHGAMTHSAMKAIEEANYQLTWAELHERLTVRLEQSGFNQHPQLEGPDERKQRQIFA